MDALGEVRSKHAAVISAFDRLLVAPGTIDRDVGRLLRRLFEDRNAADYDHPDTPPARAAAAIASAERFVKAVATWLATAGSLHRPRGEPADQVPRRGGTLVTPFA